MKKSLYLTSLALSSIALLSLGASSQSAAHDLPRPDSHAPAGVMADHTHAEGEWMLSYSYRTMGMEGNLDGSDDIALADILMPMPGTYMVAPTEMTMGMHMLGAMYAPSDRLTLMFMTNFIDTEMDHVTAMGGAFSTSTSGLGDSSIAGIFRLTSTDGSNSSSNSHVTLGLSLPTGSIDETGVTPASSPNETQLPYPMQLGSGSYAMESGYTYNHYNQDWSWGGQVKGKIQLNDNDRDYKLGSRLTATAWAAKPITANFSVSARLEWQDWTDIDGADAALNAAMVATADPSLRAGTRVDAGIGINWVTLSSDHSTFRLAAEYLVPVHQDLDGPQLGTDQSLVLKAQFSF